MFGLIGRERDDQFVLAETDSPSLARWIVERINSLLAPGSSSSPRPTGRITLAGYFEHVEDEFLADLGWHYCVAWSALGHDVHPDPQERRTGTSAGRSKDRQLVEGLVNRLNELFHS
jgi:hypothetical protein